MNGRLVGFLAVVVLLASGAARGASPDSPLPADEWRGRRVLAASPQVVLREQPNAEAAIVPVSVAGIWFNVQRAEREWLQLDYGWLRVADAVRDDQAVEFFTAELARGESAFAYICRSRAWLEKKEFDKAQADVSEALRLEPNNVRAYYTRAKIAMVQEHAEEALTACDRALAISPRDPFVFEARARLRTIAGDYNQAIGDLDAAIDLLPRAAWLRAVRGYLWGLEGNSAKAFSDFSEAIQLNPHDAYSLSERAAIHLERRELEKAMQDAERALEAVTKQPVALLVRGVVRAQQGELDAALEDLDESSRLDATDPRPFRSRGRIHYLKGEYDAAIIDYTQAISLNPDDFDSYARRSEIWSRKGDDANTILDITQYLRHRPKDANALAHRGWLLKETDPDAALKDFATALEIDPRRVRALLGRARVWKVKNDLAKAIDDTTAAIAADPRNAEAYTQRGWLRSEIDVDAALKDLDAALEINPRHVDALLQRADVWRTKQETAKAIADLTAAIEIEPANSKAYWKRAELHSSLQKHRLAVDDLTAVLKIGPNDASCLLRRSLEWSLSGNLEQALEDCRAALAIEPKDLMAYYYMAIAHEHAGQIDQAVEDFAAALRIDPQDDDIRFLFAYQLSRLDKLDQAFAQLDEVIRHGKRVAHAYNWRGYLWMQRREWDKALADLNEAIRLEPRVAGHWRMRADCRYGMKEFDKAIEDADEALRLDPKSEEAAHVRRQALEAKLDPSKAEDSLTELRQIRGNSIAVGLTEAQSAATYKIELQGPDGIKLAFQTGAANEFGADFAPFPIRLPLLGKTPVRFKLTGVSSDTNASLYGQLESKRLSPQEIAMLRDANPSISLTKADLETALSGKDVTKILVLHRREGKDASETELKVVSSSELLPNADPVATAELRGALVAMLYVSKNLPSASARLADDRPVIVCLRGPEGLMLTPEAPAPGQFGRRPVPAPLSCDLLLGTVMRLKLSGPPVGDEKYLYALLTVPPELPPQAIELAGAEWPLTISKSDLDAALEGELVTCVVYLAEPAKVGDQPRLQTVSSKFMESAPDAFAEASSRGVILAVLLLSRQIDDLSLAGFGEEPALDSRTEPPAQDGDATLKAPKR